MRLDGAKVISVHWRFSLDKMAGVTIGKCVHEEKHLFQPIQNNERLLLLGDYP